MIDLYNRRVVSWAFSGKIDQDLALRALRMTISRHRPAPWALHHSDRGWPYARTGHIGLLNERVMVCSKSRAVSYWVNAVMEHFFASLKRERTYFQNYITRAQAREDLIDYIERFYNEARTPVCCKLKTRTHPAIEEYALARIIGSLLSVVTDSGSVLFD